MTATVVRTTEQLHAALAAGLGPDQIDIQPMTPEQERACAEARAEARAEGFLEGQRLAAEQVTLTERHRILQIKALAPIGFEHEAQEAIDNGDTPGAFCIAAILEQKRRLDKASEPASPPARVH